MSIQPLAALAADAQRRAVRTQLVNEALSAGRAALDRGDLDAAVSIVREAGRRLDRMDASAPVRA